LLRQASIWFIPSGKLGLREPGGYVLRSGFKVSIELNSLSELAKHGPSRLYEAIRYDGCGVSDTPQEAMDLDPRNLVITG
jgi:hypothetical protein